MRQEQSESAPVEDRVIRENECQHVTGLSRIARWRLEQQGEFPSRIRLARGRKAHGWLKSEVQAWINLRAADR